MNKVVVDIARCEIKKKVLAEAWRVMKSFFKGRARDKKENPLWGSSIRVLVEIRVNTDRGVEARQYWINGEDIKEIKVEMKI